MIHKFEKIMKLNENWYHGTYDSSKIENHGFVNTKISIDYIKDIDGYLDHQSEIQSARDLNDKKKYFRLLDEVGKFKDTFVYNKPLFLTDNYSVAKSYANSHRSIDYQTSDESVYEVDISSCKSVKIVATGDMFSRISFDKIKDGFIRSGISEDHINLTIKRFNYFLDVKKGIRSDIVAAIGSYLDFDCIDVIGVLDSYHGGDMKSTVKIVLDISKVSILRNI